MNKIFKLFSVLAVLMLVMGLSSCIFIDAGSEQDWNNIRTEAQLNSFMNASATELSGALADNITLTDSVTAPSGKTRTLNLKGKNITINGTNTAIKAQGTLTIKDDSNTVPFVTTGSERETKHGIVKNAGQGFAGLLPGTPRTGGSRTDLLGQSGPDGEGHGGGLRQAGGGR